MEIKRSATISPDGLYRYKLQRTWNPAPRLGVCMLNPSTADDTQDDPTITRLIRRASNAEYGGIWVVNLYAFRATNPADLWKARRNGYDTRGPLNPAHWEELGMNCSDVLLAWGQLPPWSNSDGAFLQRVKEWNCKFWQLGLTKNGYPKHPLHLAYAVPMQKYQGRFA